MGIATAFVAYFVESPFFWDTIQLGSKHAYHYYETQCRLSLLPDEINSGHIPFFGYYLALCWKVFGQSLLVSHLSLLFFVWGIVFLIYSLLSRYLRDRLLLLIATLVLLSEPTLLAQFSLVSPEIMLVAGLFAVLEGRERRSIILMLMGLLLLSLISIRGIVVAGCLGLWMLWTQERVTTLVKIGLPSALVVIAYYAWHYSSEGWVGVHDESPWKESISFVDFKQWVYNVGLMGWRLLDFGRVVWVTIGGALMVNGMRSTGIPSTLSNLGRYEKLLAVFFLVFLLMTTTFAGLTGHRYYLPIILIALFGVLRGISESTWSLRVKRGVLVAIFLSQLLSHLIVYPRDIAQGWDGSLAYVPFQTLVSEMEDDLLDEAFDCSQVGTFFPLRGDRKYRVLEDVDCIYKSANVGADRYIVTSNVMNEVSPEDYSDLEDQYDRVRQWESRGVSLVLHRLK